MRSPVARPRLGHVGIAKIGQKLFVSPRTVSTHVYPIYPKLEISARGELASALGHTS